MKKKAYPALELLSGGNSSHPLSKERTKPWHTADRSPVLFGAIMIFQIFNNKIFVYYQKNPHRLFTFSLPFHYLLAVARQRRWPICN